MVYGVMKIQVIQARKQEAWGWPAVANFILGGAGAGFYLLSFVTRILEGGMTAMFDPVLFGLLSPVLVGLGFLCLAMEAGRPSRGRHLLRHVRISWISRETAASAIFVPATVLNWLFPHPVLWVLGAAAAMGLLISHGFIVYRARAITAWNVPIICLLFVTSGLATGGGLLLVIVGSLTTGRGMAVIGMICVVMNLVVWLLYLRWSHDAAFREATEALWSPKALTLTVGVGHLLPILVLFLVIVVPSVETGVELPHIAVVVAGLAMITGGSSQKACIILKAGYQRGISLGRKENVAYLTE